MASRESRERTLVVETRFDRISLLCYFRTSKYKLLKPEESMKRVRVILLMSSLTLLGACNQAPSKMNTTDANEIASRLTYIKDTRVNQCFAVVASRHIAQVTQNGFSITWVPCSPEVDSLIGK